MDLTKIIKNEGHFQDEIASAGIKLVVVDFTATWCNPCKRIAPFFEQLAAKFPQAVFLRVDVDKCVDTAVAQGISAMPTFLFYKNKTKIDLLQGADSATLESKVQQHYVAECEEAEEGTAVVVEHEKQVEKPRDQCLRETAAKVATKTSKTTKRNKKWFDSVYLNKIINDVIF